MKKIRPTIIVTSLLLVTAIFLGISDVAFAGSVSGSLKDAGITTSGKTTGLFKDLKNVVFLIMGIGGVWAVAWIVIGGMLLSGAGSNAQKRAAGIGAILCACAGLFVIYKAYEIAGWATGIGK